MPIAITHLGAIPVATVASTDHRAIRTLASLASTRYGYTYPRPLPGGLLEVRIAGANRPAVDSLIERAKAALAAPSRPSAAPAPPPSEADLVGRTARCQCGRETASRTTLGMFAYRPSCDRDGYYCGLCSD